MSSHTVSLAGTDVHYAELGGSGPPLLLLHGLTDSLRSFLPIAPRLSQAARVFAMDLRGHGRSAHTPDRYRIRDFAADVRLFLEQVVGEPAVVAGHSHGGLAASCLASHSDARLRGIFLEDPPLYRARMPELGKTHFYGFFVALRGALRSHHANNETLEDLIRFVGDIPGGPGRGTLLETVGEEAVRRRALQLRQIDPEVLSAPIEGALFDDFDPDRDLPGVGCPTHLLAGSEALGGAMTANDIDEVSARIPRCTKTIWNDVGHSIHREKPEAYAGELLSFLKRVD